MICQQTVQGELLCVCNVLFRKYILCYYVVSDCRGVCNPYARLPGLFNTDLIHVMAFLHALDQQLPNKNLDYN